jgi:hypothetical protein
MKPTRYPLPLPEYVTDLLLAAKSVCHDQASCLEHSRLSEAIGRFEEEMPLSSSGEIITARVED